MQSPTVLERPHEGLSGRRHNDDQLAAPRDVVVLKEEERQRHFVVHGDRMNHATLKVLIIKLQPLG